LNVPVEFIQYDYRDATSGSEIDRNNPLDKDEVDMVINSLVTTPSREQVYTFSGPYLELGQVLVAKTSNTSISELHSLAGKRVGAEEGATGHGLVNTFGQASSIVPFDSLSEGV